jgi:DNA replication protein DnaC
MEAHIAKWLVEESDQKRLGDAGDTPQARFESEERMVLKALEGKAPFPSIREVKERVSYRELVYRLCCEEAEYEDERRIWMGLTIAHFPSVKTLDGFDWKSGVSVDQRQIEELSQCRWVADGASLFLLGSPGVGKTHLAIALGREAVKRGYTVLFTHAVSLLANLKKASQEGKLVERLTFYSKPKLLIVEELGYLPLEHENGNLFFQLVSRR